jgi:hypothetical protein
MSAKRGKKRERPFFKHGRVEYEPWGLEREKQKQKGEIKKKKLKFSSRGSLRCYGGPPVWLMKPFGSKLLKN